MIDGLHDLLDLLGNIGTLLSNLDAGLFQRRAVIGSLPPDGFLLVRSGGLIAIVPPLPKPPVRAPQAKLPARPPTF